MTSAADYKGLASAHRHQSDPGWSRAPSWFVEVRELVDVVDFDVLCCFADLAASSEQPVDQFVALGCGQVRCVIVEGCGVLPVQWNATESGDQWSLPAVAVDDDFEACPRPVRGRSFGLVFTGHLR